eukprot:scaffold2.g7526.t1
MDFSDCIAHTCAPIYSPDGRLLASAEGYRVVVRECESLAVAALFSCLDCVEELSWSPDSDRLLCSLFKRATVQVFSVSDSEWSCTIAEGPAGIVAARWSPDSRHILLTSDFAIRLSVWSLVDQSCQYLRGPKHAAALAFSPDGGLLAVAHRIDCKDVLAIYECTTWAPAAQFALGTQDAAGVAWSPDGDCIAAWESPLYGHGVVVHTPEGECLTSYSAYKGLLGLKAVAWSPSGQLLALGGYDAEACVLNHVTWSPLVRFSHPALVRGPAAVVAYTEEQVDEAGRRVLGENSGWAGGGRGGSRPGSRAGSPSKPPAAAPAHLHGSPTKLLKPDGSLKDLGEEGEAADLKSRYAVAELPLRVPVARPAADKGGVRQGVGSVSWSFDGSYMLTRCDNMPTTLWVWETSKLELASVVLQSWPVRAAEWDPTSNRLVVLTGSSKLYLWTPDGASCVHIPLPGFRAAGVRWHPSGKALLLTNKSSFACAYL